MHFYAPEIKDRGAYCFDLAVFLSSSLKLYNLATGITFERWVLARALIIHMSIPCEKTFRWLHVSLFWTLWPWPWSLTHSLKILNLLITFEQWVLRAFILHMNIANPTCIKIFVLVTYAIFGIGHYRGHLCFTNTSCWELNVTDSEILGIINLYTTFILTLFFPSSWCLTTKIVNQ